MILEEETFKKFGYYPRNLKSQSSKRILAVCDECNKVRETSKNGYRNLCRSCAHKGKHCSDRSKQKMSEARIGIYCGENHPLYGKSFSNESKHKMSEAHKGESNSNWKGGISFEPYCVLFNDEFRERVRAYWNYKCVLCGKTETEQMNEMKKNKKLSFRLSVHHVNYNKETCCDESNPLFVSLCVKCHSKTNFNKEYWENEFKRIIYSKNIDGKCFYTKEEMEEIKKKEKK